MMISQLKILKGIPFGANDKVVITFNSVSSQYNFFNNFTIADYRNTSFIKGFYNKKIKIDVDFEEVKYANYVMFKNNDLEDDRWNYAYITNIEYISDNCTYIEIEIDNFQTYMGDIIFGECKMEREMTDVDELNYNLLWEDEPELEVNNYIITGHNDFNFENWKVCVCYKPNLIVEKLTDNSTIGQTSISGSNQLDYRDYTAPQYSQYFRRGGVIYNKYMSGCAFKIFNLTNDADFESVTNELWKLEILGYSILSIYMIPSEFDSPTMPYQSIIINPDVQNPYYTDKKINIYDTAGYIPINAKCYTSPYMYLEVSNKQGDMRQFNYQNFDESGDIAFIMLGTFLNKCDAIIMPRSYKHPQLPYDSDLMYDYGIPIKEMPQCQWNSSLADMARGGMSLITDAIMAVATGGASLPITGAKLATGIGKQALDPTTKGMNAIPVLQILSNKIGWTFRQYTTAQINEIDDYFSQFGYHISATHRPNILGNRRFNYVKTKNAVIRGDIPINARNDIIDKLNNGITFWHDLTNFEYGDFRGNYLNEIVGTSLTNEGKIFNYE